MVKSRDSSEDGDTVIFDQLRFKMKLLNTIAALVIARAAGEFGKGWNLDH
jgi:hypothetical protein